MRRKEIVYKFIIEGNPIPLARHRKGKYGMYDSQKREKESFLWKCVSQIKSVPAIGGVFKSTMKFYCSMPKSWSQKKKDSLNGEYRPSRPDLDNYIKFVLDAIPDYFADDALMVDIKASKMYSQNPRTEITLEEI